jgi:hypothetical protein
MVADPFESLRAAVAALKATDALASVRATMDGLNGLESLKAAGDALKASSSVTSVGEVLRSADAVASFGVITEALAAPTALKSLQETQLALRASDVSATLAAVRLAPDSAWSQWAASQRALEDLRRSSIPTLESIGRMREFGSIVSDSISHIRTAHDAIRDRPAITSILGELRASSPVAGLADTRFFPNALGSGLSIGSSVARLSQALGDIGHVPLPAESLREIFETFRSAADLVEVDHSVRDQLQSSLPVVPDSPTAEAIWQWQCALLQWMLDWAILLGKRFDVFGVLVSLVVAPMLQSNKTPPEMAEQLNRIERRVTELQPARPSFPQPSFTARTAGVYETPNTKSKRLTKLQAGIVVTVLSCEGQWCHVEWLDLAAAVHQQGWIYKPRLAMLATDRK